MAHTILRNQALVLRKKGFTYTDIRKKLNISKGTLSNWLKDYPLSNAELNLLEIKRSSNKAISIEKIRNTKTKKREQRINGILNLEKFRILPLSKRDVEIAGLMLYWGEGNKRLNGPISISNSDPQVIIFALYWIITSLKIPKEKVRVILHLYKDMDIENEIEYWGNILGIPASQFCKPYIKKVSRYKINHSGFKHGTCGIYFNNVRIKEKLMMCIKAIADNYSKYN